MPISTQSAKAKGRRLQQWTRDLILRLWPTLTADDVRSTSMGAGGVDVQLSSASQKLVPFAIECKAKKTHAIYRLYEQAVSNKGTLEPLLIIKGDRKKPLAVVDAEKFFGYIKEIND